MGCRWTKNVNQGSDGSMVDDLLQLSNLQRLARQKIVEMEVCTAPRSLSCSLFSVRVLLVGASSAHTCTTQQHVLKKHSASC